MKSLTERIRDWLRARDGTVKPWTGTDKELNDAAGYDSPMADAQARKSDRRWFGIKFSWRW